MTVIPSIIIIIIIIIIPQVVVCFLFVIWTSVFYISYKVNNYYLFLLCN